VPEDTTTTTTTTVPEDTTTTTTTTVPEDTTTTTTTTVPTTTTTSGDGGTTTTTTTVPLEIAGIERHERLEIAGISEELPFTGGFESVGFIAGGASTVFGAALLAISSRFRKKR
jgi:hypothetical protein